MDDAKKTKLRNAGIEIDSMLERFMDNEKMINHFMIKFLSDSNMDTLRRTLESDDTELAFRAAHTLKGLCRNLSMLSLDKVMSEMTELLRGNDLSGAKEMMPEAEKVYNDTITVIKENFDAKSE